MWSVTLWNVVQNSGSRCTTLGKKAGLAGPGLQITPMSIGGGIGQSRTFMLFLKKAHLGEVSAAVWPRVLKDMCRKRNIHVIE